MTYGSTQRDESPMKERTRAAITKTNTIHAIR